MGSCVCVRSCFLSESALLATIATTRQDAAQEITVPGLALGAGSHSAWQRPRLVLCASLTESVPGPGADHVIECGKALGVSGWQASPGVAQVSQVKGHQAGCGGKEGYGDTLPCTRRDSHVTQDCEGAEEPVMGLDIVTWLQIRDVSHMPYNSSI